MPAWGDRIRQTWVQDTPLWSFLRVCKSLARGKRLWMTRARMLLILRTLESEGVRVRLAGGWGVDALIGHQTRMHGDLDLILEDWDRDEPRACQALEALGFAVIQRRASPFKLPRSANLEDRFERRVDLLALSLAFVCEAAGWRETCGDATASECDVCPRAFTTGSIDGHAVPCLSAPTQVVMYSGHQYEQGRWFEENGQPESAILDYKQALAGQPDEDASRLIYQAKGRRTRARLYRQLSRSTHTTLATPAEQALVEARLRALIERRIFALERLVATSADPLAQQTSSCPEVLLR